jgi:short-subunit dehydrogenase
MTSYSGKTIWIIGASTGIGAATARELAKRGAKVVLSARSIDTLEALKANLNGDGHKVLPIDVSQEEQVLEAMRKINAEGIKIDSVLFLAALYDPMKTDDWDMNKIKQMIRVNLDGAFFVSHAVLKMFKSQGGGQLALCGSVAGYIGLPNGQPYSATKAAIMNLAESLRSEFSATTIDIRLISPGFVRTPLTDKNTFKMPMMIEPEDAAKSIADGLLSSSFEIHFPKKFTFIMKFLRLLPYALYFPIAQKMKG